MGATKTNAAGPPPSWQCAITLFKALVEHWKTALFMACLLHLGPVEDLLAPLKSGAVSWAQLIQHFHIQEAKPTQAQHGVVLISPERFETYYAGRKPLPRDALLKDLQLIPESSFIALDIDISPMPPGPHNVGQEALYSYIEANAHRFLLILPFPVHDAGVRAQKVEWLLRMCGKNVPFADPRIEQKFGIVTRELPNPVLSFSHLVNQVIERREDGSHPTNTGANFLCEVLRQENSDSQTSVARDLLTPLVDEAKLDHLATEVCRNNKNLSGCGKPHPRLLHFGKAHVHVARSDFCGANASAFKNSECSRSDAKLSPVPHVMIVGGNYDLADRFMTPLGEMPGAVLHAIAAQSTSIEELKLVELAVDFVLGLVFGAVAHSLWGVWLKSKLRSTPVRLLCWHPFSLSPHSAWLALLMLAIFLAVLTACALVLAAWLLVLRSIWVSPIPMVVGMTLDALVLGNAGAASHQLAHASLKHAAQGSRTPVARTEPIGWNSRAIGFFPWLIWGGVIAISLGGTFLKIIKEWI